jgi:hypothetical protein
VIVLAYFIGLPRGPIGVALAFSASVAALRLPSIIYCFRGTNLSVEDLWIAVWRPMLSSIAAGALLFGFGRIAHVDLPLLLGLGLDFLVYGASYLLVWIGLPSGRRSLAEITGIARDLQRARPAQEEIRDTDLT